MLRPLIATVDKPDWGRLTTQDLGGGLIETKCEGFIGKELTKQLLEQTPRVLSTGKNLCWLVDLTKMKVVEANAQEPGREIFSMFKQAGGLAFAFVSSGDSTEAVVARTLIRAVAVVARIKVHFTHDREAAVAHLRELGQRSEPPR
ncbi:MAG: hypothetical protein U0271_23635 [Polyangiaceae bacterium]